MPDAQGAVTASWIHQRAGQWILVDGRGSPRGSFDRQGFNLRQTAAVVDGQPFTLSKRGLWNHRMEALDSAGRTVVTAHARGFGYRGEVTLADGEVYSLTRKLGVPVLFFVGDPSNPLLVMGTRRRRGDLTFQADLARHAPAVLPTMLLLLLVHERGTSAA